MNESIKETELITLSDAQLKAIVTRKFRSRPSSQDPTDQIARPETLSIDTLKRYSRIFRTMRGSDSDKSSEYRDYIFATLKYLSANDGRDYPFGSISNVSLPQVHSLEDGLAECLSPMRCQLSLPNLKEVSEECLKQFFSRKCSFKIWRNSDNLLEIGLNALNKQNATFIGKHFGQLSLPDLKAIDTESAKKLRGIVGTLRLGITEEVNVETAQALVDLPKKSEDRTLMLDRLKSVTPEVLQVLCQNKGPLILGLEEVHSEHMSLLTAKVPGTWSEGKFELPKMRKCSRDGLKLLVEFHKRWRVTGLNLDSLEVLCPDDAKILADHAPEAYEHGELYLNGIKNLDEKTAEALSSVQAHLSVDGLTELSDATAEALSKHRGELYLNGLTKLSDAASESLAKHQRGLYLSGLTELSDAGSESFSKHDGHLDLSGLTELSDAAAESLSKHDGRLDLYGLKKLSSASLAEKHIDPNWGALEDLSTVAAEALAKSGRSDLRFSKLTELSDPVAKALTKSGKNLEFSELTQLSDSVAETLAKHEGEITLPSLEKLSQADLAEKLAKNEYGLSLDGLVELSDAAAEALSKHEGNLSLNGLIELSDAAAKSLSKRKGDLSLNGLAELPDAAAEAFSQHKGGELSLNGLTKLSVAAAESLAKHGGELFLNGLKELSERVAEALAKHDSHINLKGLSEISEGSAKAIAKHESVSLDGLTELSDTAAEALAKGEGYLSVRYLEEFCGFLAVEE